MSGAQAEHQRAWTYIGSEKIYPQEKQEDIYMGTVAVCWIDGVVGISGSFCVFLEPQKAKS